MQHGTTQRVSYPSTAADGSPTTLTGLVHLPDSAPPPVGWPVVTYGHMTTGAGSRSAPSTGSPGHPEWRRMSQGDALCDGLLARGVAVLRPDYPGLGSPGTHPYLIGEPLARSVIDMVAARASFDERIGTRWVSAGHSEGSVAALFTSVAPHWPVPLLAVAAFAPVTRTDLTIGLSARLPTVPPGFGVLSALIAMMLLGAGTASPRVAELLEGDDLGPEARTLWPQLGERCLSELAAPDSWGGLAPRRIASPGLYRELFAVLRANEVAGLVPRVPVRIDSGLIDEVAPAPLTARLARTYARAGVDVTHRRWPTHHSGTMQPQHAPSEAVDWICSRLSS